MNPFTKKQWREQWNFFAATIIFTAVGLLSYWGMKELFMEVCKPDIEARIAFKADERPDVSITGIIVSAVGSLIMLLLAMLMACLAFSMFWELCFNFVDIAKGRPVRARLGKPSWMERKRS